MADGEWQVEVAYATPQEQVILPLAMVVSNLVNFLSRKTRSSSNAGPPENADARKRGARMAVIQNGLAARPE